MNSKEQFIHDAKAMWAIRNSGIRVDLQPELTEVSKHVFRKIFKNRSTSFYYQIIDNNLNIYIEESKGKFDWIQNFLAFSYKIGTGKKQRRYHLGFYITAITIFNYLQRENILTDNINIYGYSHGAGAAPILSFLITTLTAHNIQTVIGFEQPRYILFPNPTAKEEGKEYLRYTQGKDIVPAVPWWMTHLGYQRKIDGPTYTSWKKRLLCIFYDHDIYWTKKV